MAAWLISGCLVAVSSVTPGPTQLPQVRQCADTSRLCQFRLVAAAEFLEALRVVAIPLAQLR
jgi:hypothetical protein